MKRHMKSWAFCLVLTLSLLLGAARPAAAQTTGQLPETKNPPSARFTLSGTMTITTEGQQINGQISGGGSMSGTNYQQDVTVALSGAGLPGSTSVTTSMIVLDGKLYQRTTGVGQGDEGQWYVMDASQLAGGMLPGMGTGMTTGLDPAYAEAYRVQQMGKEQVHGAPTTKYQVDVDLPMLLELTGMDDAESMELLRDATLTMFLWVGDNDMYVHRLQMVMNINIASGGSTGALSMDMMMDFMDFGAPVTITAPPNALPLEMAGSSSILPILGTGMPVSAGTGGMSTGMPRTGEPTETWPQLALLFGLTCIASGALVRRRAVVRIEK